MTDKPNDGGPAFPAFVPDGTIREEVDMDARSVTEYPGGKQHPGMSLRDYFAAKASDEVVVYFVKQYMQVLKTNEPDAWKEPLVYSDWHCEKVAMIEARYRYALADAMLKARGQ